MEIFTYFVSGEKYFNILETVIDNVATRLYISIFLTTTAEKPLEILQKISNKAKTLKETKLLINYEAEDFLRKQIVEALSEIDLDGMDIYIQDEEMSHAKVILADRLLLLGSTNLTQASLERDTEANIITNDPSAIKGAEAWFNRMFDKAYKLNI